MTTIRGADDVAATPPKAANIALWTQQVLVAMAFVAAGSGKLLGTADMIALFQAVGIGQWFRYVTGLLEVLGAVLLLVPGKAAPGAVLLTSVMAGAVVAHLTVLHTAATVPLVLFALTGLIAWGRRSQLTRLSLARERKRSENADGSD